MKLCELSVVSRARNDVEWYAAQEYHINQVIYSVEHIFRVVAVQVSICQKPLPINRYK